MGRSTTGSAGARWCRAVPTAVLALLMLTGCGVSIDKGAHAIKATVSGLAGSGLELWMNSHDPVPANGDGEVMLAYMVTGYYYSVTVKTQPTSPTQTCAVANGSGVMGTADVTDVTVTCATVHSIGGTVSGLTGSGLVLNNALGDSGPVEDLAVPATSSTFNFSNRAVTGTTYAVTVKTQPSAPTQTCSVGKGSGTAGNTDVTDVSVVCSNNAYSVGGTVSGLAGGATVVLRNNGADDLTLSAHGSFTFAQKVADGATYAVMVKTQPTNPWQTCTVSNGTGTIGGAAVSNVALSCAVNSYSIGGSVSGLVSSGLALTTNGQSVTVNAGSMVFIFTNPFTSGTTYEVKVAAQPTNPYQVCSVTNGSDKIEGAPVTNVVVGCKCGQNSACSGNADTCSNGTCMCGQNAACANGNEKNPTADHCLNGTCMCGQSAACSSLNSACCGGVCVDTYWDSNNCQGCGLVCGQGLICCGGCGDPLHCK